MKRPINQRRRGLPGGSQGPHTPGGRYGYRKEARRLIAERNPRERDSRTDEEQLAKLDAEGWDAARERDRLNKRIQESISHKKIQIKIIIKITPGRGI